jgi:hypothetical protein
VAAVASAVRWVDVGDTLEPEFQKRGELIMTPLKKRKTGGPHPTVLLFELDGFSRFCAIEAVRSKCMSKRPGS